MAKARLYADQVEAMRKECGEYLVPLQEGLIGPDHIVGSLGDVLLGRVPGRSSGEEITLFDALGLPWRMWPVSSICAAEAAAERLAP